MPDIQPKMTNEKLKLFCDSLVIDGENLDRFACAALLRLKKSTLLAQFAIKGASGKSHTARSVQPQTVFIVELLKGIKSDNPQQFDQLLRDAIKAGNQAKKK